MGFKFDFVTPNIWFFEAFSVYRVVTQAELESQMKKNMIYQLGFNTNCYTFTLILLTKIVLCSKFSTECIKHRCFVMKSGAGWRGSAGRIEGGLI